MIDEDDIPENVKRGVENALFGRGPRKTVVEVKRPFRPKGPSARERQERREAQVRIYDDTKRGEE